MIPVALEASHYTGLVKTMSTPALIGSVGVCDAILATLGETRKAKTGKLAEDQLARVLLGQFKGKAKKAVEYIANGVKTGKIASEADLVKELAWVGNMMGNVSPSDAKEIVAATTLLYSVEKGDISKTMGLKFALNQADQYAIGALGRDQVWYIGDFYNDAMSKRIQQITNDIVLNQGLGKAEAAAELRTAMAAEFGIGRGAQFPVQIPSGWKGTVDDYFKMLASTIHDRAANLGRVVTFTEAGVTTYRIEAVLDERTSEICQIMNGQTFDIQYAQDYANRYYSATSKDEVDKVVKWREPGQVQRFQGNEAELAKAGMALPPYHASCRTVVVAVAFQAIGGGAAPVMEPPKTPPKISGPAAAIPRLPKVPKAPAKPKTPADPVGDDLKNGKIQRVKQSEQGCNETHRLQLESGREGAFKPGEGENGGLLRNLRAGAGKPGDMAAREVAASEFDRMTGWGVVPRTVVRSVDEMGIKGVGSMQEWIKDAKVASKFTNTELSRMIGTERGKQMEIMDLILGNGDRHRNNFIFEQATGKLWAIDNGLCCPVGRPTGGATWQLPHSRIDASAGKADKSILEFIDRTTPEQVKNVLTGAGVDEASAGRAANRFMYIKEHKSILAKDNWNMAYDAIADGIKDLGLLSP